MRDWRMRSRRSRRGIRLPNSTDGRRRRRFGAEGGCPDGLPYVEAAPPPATPRETFVFFINGAKVRAPHGAMALTERVGG